MIVLLASAWHLSLPGSRNVPIFVAGVLAVTMLFGYHTVRAALRPLKDMIEAQKEFIGNVAHELRTPLTVIKTNTEIYLVDESLPQSVHQVLRSNLEEIDRISDTITNLMSLNALAEPEDMQFMDTDVGKIVHRVVNRLSQFTKDKPVKLVANVGSERRAWGNASAIEQMVTNLVKNAINHTESGSITVLVTQVRHGLLSIIVRDTGRGIPHKDLYRIFEPFYRGDQAKARGTAGSGLGLSIVSELVRLHHGRISIKSALGRGTRVSITLPVGRKERRSKQPESESATQEEGMNEVALDFSNNASRDRTPK